MREILFRGKRQDNGEWVEGFYNYHDYIFNDKPVRRHYILPLNAQDAVVVLSETVGQYTGLKDKNGKKIFEGDIVKVKHGYAGNPNHPTAEYIEVVEYDTRSCCYEFYRWSGDIYYVEVIGNIYDNPELLNGGTEDD